jgi:hypothetical protein
MDFHGMSTPTVFLVSMRLTMYVIGCERRDLWEHTISCQEEYEMNYNPNIRNSSCDYIPRGF